MQMLHKIHTKMAVHCAYRMCSITKMSLPDEAKNGPLATLTQRRLLYISQDNVATC